MAKCEDCKGGTPAPAWKRCVECAMKRLRFILSEGRVTQSEGARRFARGDRVFVNGAIQSPGVIVRVRDTQYTVRLDKGGRCYVYAEDLRELEERRLRVRRAAQ